MFGKRRCPSCGEAYERDQLLCLRCGTVLQQGAPRPDAGALPPAGESASVFQAGAGTDAAAIGESAGTDAPALHEPAGGPDLAGVRKVAQEVFAAIGGVVISLFVFALGGHFDAPVGIVLRVAAVWAFFTGIRKVAASAGKIPRALQGGFAAAGAPYREFAAKVDGHLAEKTRSIAGVSVAWPEAVTFARGDAPVRLDMGTITAGKSQSYCTQITFTLPRPAAVRWRITPQSAPEWLRHLVGMQDVNVGVPEFDDRFLVEASDEALAQAALTPEVQQALQGLVWARDTGTNPGPAVYDVSLEGDALRLRALRIILSTDDLVAFCDGGGRVFDAVARGAVWG